MGTCATKPREMKESDAPLPMEKRENKTCKERKDKEVVVATEEEDAGELAESSQVSLGGLLAKEIEVEVKAADQEKEEQSSQKLIESKTTEIVAAKESTAAVETTETITVSEITTVEVLKEKEVATETITSSKITTVEVVKDKEVVADKKEAIELPVSTSAES